MSTMFGCNKTFAYVRYVVWSVLICYVGSQEWLIDRIIPTGYNPNEAPLRPNVNQGTILVNGNIVINNFEASYDQWSLHTDLMLCLQWHDYRLVDINPVVLNTTGLNESVHYSSVKLRQFSRFWMPRIYFRNGLSVAIVNSLRDIQYLEVTPQTKMVNWCTRLNVQTTCHFNLSNFPFDAQNCYYELESFSNLNQEMRIKLTIQAEIGGNFQFRLHHTWNGSCPPMNLDPFSETRLVNVESCAFGAVRLVRHLSYYVIRYYAPTFLCLVTSFCSFWVATNGWPARIIFTCVVYLTVKVISQTAYDEVPANDTVSLFWWLWIIQFFIYMNLIEYAVALAWVQFAEDKNRAHAAGVPSPDGYYFGKNSWFAKGGYFLEIVLFKIFGPIDFYRDPAGRNKVDYVARVLYPSIMLLFVSIYMVATIPAWVKIYQY